VLGRVIADGTVEDDARAAKMDERRRRPKLSPFFCSFSYFFSLVKGASSPESCTTEGDGYPLSEHTGMLAGSLCFS